MILRGVKQTDQTALYRIWAVPGGSSGQTGGFHQNLARQLKEHYKDRVIVLFDEINKQAISLVNIDLTNFERYRALIKDLLSEVVNNAFTVSKECILDRSGRQRVYSTVNIIDEKLDEIASNILDNNIDHINFISRIDEIRGLVMDMLL